MWNVYPATVAKKTSSNLYNCTVEATIQGKALSFTPDAPLLIATEYRLVVPAGAVKNNYGVLNSAVSVPFTTVAFGSCTASPANLAEGVKVDAPITLTFDSAPSASSDLSGITLASSSGNAAITAAISGRTLTVTPQAPLSRLTRYTLTVPAGALLNQNGVSYALRTQLAFTTAIDESMFAGGVVCASYCPYFGGLVGNISGGGMKGCASYLDISVGSGGNKAYVGGLVGVSADDGTVFDRCVYSGRLQVSNSGTSSDIEILVGGIVGKINYDSHFNNCRSSGSIAVTSDTTYPVFTTELGGIVGGGSWCTISGCVTNVEIAYDGDSTTYSQANGRTVYAGGLVGNNKHVCEYSESHGDVRVSVDYQSYVQVEVGGLVGYNKSRISNCFATGNASTMVKARSGVGYAGGLMGAMGNTATVSNSYSVGDARSDYTGVYNSYVSQVGRYAGSFCGQISGTLENCYSLGGAYECNAGNINHFSSQQNTLAPTLTNVYHPEYISGLGAVVPAEQLHTTSGYAGFDFDRVWAIDLEQNSGYPILNSPIKGVHAEDCVTDYDGELHSVVVTAPGDVSVAYSLDAESYSAEPPVFLSAPLPTQVFYRAERGDDTLYGVALMWLKPVVSAVTAAYADVIMPEGGTLRLEAAATAPTEALASLTWACDKPDILALDSATGRIRALAAGTAAVTARALDGGEACAVIAVTVLGGERITLPRSIKSIDADALSGIAATSVDARECFELTSIGSRAFADNAALRLIVLGDGVELIADDAFEGSDNVRVRCPKDSPAMLFAQDNGIPYDCLTAE